MNIFNNDSINQLLTVRDEMIGPDISRVLIIYTGGTIGMKNTENGYQPAQGYLTQTLASMVRFNDPNGFQQSPTIYDCNVGQPSDMVYRPLSEDFRNEKSLETYFISGVECIKKRLTALITPPSIYKKRTRYSILEYDKLLDSSNMNFEDWVRIATDIQVNYKLFDAFIILHGTDTMAYTASVLSFMMENLGKTIIITGSQIPLSEVRNDAIENILGYFGFTKS
jgi:lysophospholipase